MVFVKCKVVRTKVDYGELCTAFIVEDREEGKKLFDEMFEENIEECFVWIKNSIEYGHVIVQ